MPSLVGAWGVIGLQVAAAQGAGACLETDEDRIRDMFELSLEELLNNTVVSASLVEEDAWVAPSIISAISSCDLEAYGHLSVADALQHTAGFYVVYDYVNYNVGVRGVNGGMGAQSQVIKTMIAGRDARFRPTAGSWLGPELFPTLAIKQVEVVRGPVSALYGADAFLGAINVIPMTAEDMGPGHARARVRTLNDWGNWGALVEGAAWGESHGLDVLAAATVRSADRGGLSLPEVSPRYPDLVGGLGHDSVPQDDELAVSAFGQVVRRWEGGALTIDGNVQRIQRDANFSFESSPLGGGVVGMYNAGSTVRVNHAFGERVRLNSFASYSGGAPTSADRLRDRVRQGYAYLQRTMDYQGTEERLELVYTTRSPGLDRPLSLTVGGDHLWSDVAKPAIEGVRSDGGPPVPLGVESEPLTQHNHGAFAQLRADLVDWASLVVGGRVEDHTQYEPQLSYRGGLALAGDRLSVKALYGRSFKAPSVALLYASPVIAGGPQANPELEPQLAQTGEVQLNWAPTPWVRGGLTGYVSRLTEFATIDTESFSSRAENSSTIDACGGELDGQLEHSSGIGGFLSASYVVTRQVMDEHEERASVTAPLFPALSVAAGIQYHQPDLHLRWTLLDRFVSARHADPSNSILAETHPPLAPYNVLSVGVSTWGLEALDDRSTTFGVQVNNVLNTKYADPGFLGIDLPGQERQVMFTAEQTF